jgi:hypothetical protein
MATSSAMPRVIRENNRTYIVDRTGEQWEVTQAESVGFKPEGFQYGLGRDAFTPLDDSHLDDEADQVRPGLRVIGVAQGSQAQAYSISRLSVHEVANSQIGADPIAVGY